MADIAQFDDLSFLPPVGERIRSRDMDAGLVSHLRSEYFIYSFSISRTTPLRESRRSSCGIVIVAPGTS